MRLCVCVCLCLGVCMHAREKQEQFPIYLKPCCSCCRSVGVRKFLIAALTVAAKWLSLLLHVSVLFF